MIGPYLIEAVYHVKPVSPQEHSWLKEAFERVTKASGLSRAPRLGIAEIDMPNAFAYGNPLKGNAVAVTRGLLQSLPREEVEAVLGHEVGHLKHRDVAFMMMISIIPALVYYVGYSLYISGWFGARSSKESGGGGAPLLLVGIALIILSFIFNLFVFYFSRLREYYADAHAAMNTNNGAKNLQRGLVRIMNTSGKLRKFRRTEPIKKLNEFKMFFISDPNTGIEGFGEIDELVEKVKNTKPSPIAELFSTHPHPAKRLKNLDKFT